MIFTSAYPAVTISQLALTPFTLHKAQQLGDKPALIDGPTGRTLTYAQLDHAVRLVAANLVKRGLRKGDVLGIYCPNIPEYAIAFHGTALAGGTNTIINPLYTVNELVFQLQDSGCKYLVTVPPLLEKACEAAARSGVQEIFVLGDGSGATPFATLLAGDAAMPPVEINVHEDVAVLPYSSGTTGLPKGVMLTHNNLVANMCQLKYQLPFTENDRILGLLPLFHILGMALTLNMSLYSGATVVLMPRFDFEQMLKLIQDFKLTHVPAAPPIVLALARHPLVDKYDLSSVKAIICGGAPLPIQVANACADRLHCVIKQGYGLTECSPGLAVGPDDLDRSKWASNGTVLPNTECKILDYQTREPLGPDQQGEIWVRGPQVMKGYLNQPAATGAMIDAAGWLCTGDVGYADSDGCIYVVDRIKELIKYKGVSVAPAELESLLLTHPGVADAVVIPSPDEEAGEVPKAFVVLKPDAAPSAEEIMTFVADRVAPHKKVRKLEFTGQIPRSASGKLLRRSLIEQERAQAAAT